VYVNNGTFTVHSSSIVGNYPEGVRRTAATVAINNSILWKNWDDVVGAVTLSYCDVEDGDAGTGCISANPRFLHGLYLGAGSPCANVGSMTAAAAGLSGKTTSPDGATDGGVLDLGYHASAGISPSIHELFVKPAGNDSNTGTNWANAFKTVTKATRTATEGSYVFIDAGVYSTTNGETFPIMIKRYGISVFGANPATTILHAGGSLKRVLQMTDNSFATISGLRITDGGKLTWAPIEEGAGILTTYAHEQTLASCVVSNNTSGREGGGIYVGYQSDVVITNSVIVRNTLDILDRDLDKYGGGIFAYNSYGTLVDSMLLTNRTVNSYHGYSNTRSAGGGLALYGGAWNVIRTVFALNSSLASGSDYLTKRGAGVHIVSGTHTFRSCVIAKNRAMGTWGSEAGYGDGINVENGTVVMNHATIAGNLGEGISRVAGSVAVTNGIIWGNGDDVVGTVTLAYCDVEDGDNNLTNGCVKVDPLFVDTVYYHEKSQGGHYLNGYFTGGTWGRSVTEHSPCIDEGNPTSPYDEEAYPHGRNANMGGYGNTSAASKTPGGAGSIFMFL